MCSVSVAVMFGMAAIVCNAAAAINIYFAASYAAAAVAAAISVVSSE